MYCACSCFLYISSESNELGEVDKLDGSVALITPPLGLPEFVALSPSDVVTHLFGTTGGSLQRIDVNTGSATTIAPGNLGIDVNFALMIFRFVNIDNVVGHCLQSRR
jgi:hypothetical protein